MARIKGRFAPIFEELGNDERFLYELTDFQKLVFLLVLYTSHMTRHKAPSSPSFYKKRYGLTAPGSALASALERVRCLFPGVKVGLSGGKEILSFANSTTYKNQILLEEEVEEEKEEEREVKSRVSPSPAPKELFNLFKSTVTTLPLPSELTKDREVKCRLRLRERSLEQWALVFSRMNASGFLGGANDRGWKASFDWIISNATNSAKVLEGKYDNREVKNGEKSGVERLREIRAKGVSGCA